MLANGDVRLHFVVEFPQEDTDTCIPQKISSKDVSMLFKKVIYFSMPYFYHLFHPTTQTHLGSQGKSITKECLGQLIACLSVKFEFSAGF